MRQKKKESDLKAAGKEVVKKTRPKIIQPGKDDCGEDMTPIMFVDYQPEMFYDLGATSPEAKCEFQLPEDVELESFLMNMEGGLNPIRAEGGR